MEQIWKDNHYRIFINCLNLLIAVYEEEGERLVPIQELRWLLSHYDL
ncbi:MAG: hypothetical protein H6Q74_2164 [Firmicutes bacterium]|nr:hypothetical protein [Bacillota bacterium]